MELFTDVINGTPSPSFLRKETISWKSVSPVHLTIYPKKGSTLILCGTLYVTDSLLFFVRDESLESNLKKRRRSSLLASLGFFKKQEQIQAQAQAQPQSDDQSLRRSITSSVSNGSKKPLLLERIKSSPTDTSTSSPPSKSPITAVRIPLVALDSVATSKTFSAVNLRVAIKKGFLSSSHLLAASVIPIADVVVEFKHPFLHGEAHIFMQKVKAAMDKEPAKNKVEIAKQVQVATNKPIAV